MNDQVIIVDLDGTLCNIDHRVDFAQSGDWDGFQSLLHRDGAYEDVAKLVRHFSLMEDGPEVWAVSGREEKWRNVTTEWLRNEEIFFDRIYLRPTHNRETDAVFKIGLLTDVMGSIEEARKRVWFVLEDRDKMVDSYRSAGLPCWQVRHGTY